MRNIRPLKCRPRNYYKQILKNESSSLGFYLIRIEHPLFEFPIFEGKAEIVTSLSPKPTTGIIPLLDNEHSAKSILRFIDLITTSLSDQDYIIIFPEYCATTRAFLYDSDLLKFRFIPVTNLLLIDTDYIDSVEFSIINFLNGLSSTNSCWVFNFDNFTIEFNNQLQNKKYQLYLEKYIFSHKVRISPNNSKTIKAREMGEFIENLIKSISFVQGFFVSSLEISFIENKLSKTKILSQSSAEPIPFFQESIFDPNIMNEHNICGILLSICKFLKNNEIRMDFLKVIDFYCISNSSKYSEQSILLSQSALEMLSYLYFVKLRKTKKDRDFSKKDYHAENKIRDLLSEFKIPTDFNQFKNSDYKIILPIIQKFKIIDGPKLITFIRNKIVHPKNKEGINHKILEITSELTLWYLELSIMRLCDYNGEYSSRLKEKSMNVDCVPWKDSLIHHAI